MSLNYLDTDKFTDLQTQQELIAFLKKNKFTITSNIGSIENLYLHIYQKRLSLSSRKSPKLLPLYVDFCKAPAFKRVVSPHINGELLAKCLGKKHFYKTLLDATAGMGTDAMLFSAMGLDVWACEWSAVTYLLLKDGLRRAKVNSQLLPMVQRIQLSYQDSLDFLKITSCSFDVIYLDFMFSEKDKKSKSKKGMELFKNINKKQLVMDPEALLEQYLKFEYKRLIIKRPLKAKVLYPHQHSHSIFGKSIRFDIYVA